MTRFSLLLAGAVFLATANGPAMAQGVLQSLAVIKIDPATLAPGLKTSEIAGSSVVAENIEVVGKIEDLIVTASDKVPFAVLSICGFPGVDATYIAIPLSSLEFGNQKIVLRGATKESLKALPVFKYAS